MVAVENVPSVHAYRDGYALCVTLLAAMRLGATLVLVDKSSESDAAEDALGECLSVAPHPRPLSPEYRGEGSQNLFEKGTGIRHGEGCQNIGQRREDKRAEEGSQKFSDDVVADRQGEKHKLRTEGLASEQTERVDWLAGGDCRIGLFTSGTTGKPKLVLHTLDSLTRGVRAGDKHQADVWGLAYHPAHIAGLQVLFQALANHNPVVRLFDLPVDQVHQAIEADGITHLSATPTFFNLLCGTGQPHPNVRSVTSGGELSQRSLRERMASTFPNARIHNIYASTEAGSLLTSSGDQFQVPKAYEERIKIIEGELAIHRSLLAASLQANWPDEFYRTGDCVEVLDSSPLTIRFVSRQGDWINVGGYKVNPHEVEQALLEMAEVQEAVVYGRDNSVTGSLVCCDIVLSEGTTLTTKDVHARLAPSMPAYMIPRIVRCVDAIQTTHTGKKERSP